VNSRISGEVGGDAAFIFQILGSGTKKTKKLSYFKPLEQSSPHHLQQSNEMYLQQAG